MDGFKRCFKCLCHKPVDDFYKHAAMSDGRFGKCKDCTKNDVKLHRQQNLEKVRSYDRMRGSMPHRVAARATYQKTPAAHESHRLSLRKYRMKHPERDGARAAVQRALKSGKLIAWPVCAVPGCCDKPEGHHPDYERPLEVVWLCTRHHSAAHAIAREYFRERSAT